MVTAVRENAMLLNFGEENNVLNFCAARKFVSLLPHSKRVRNAVFLLLKDKKFVLSEVKHSLVTN